MLSVLTRALTSVNAPCRFQMKPADDKTDYTSLPCICCVHNFCGACELVQLANIADRRAARGAPVCTPIKNPAMEAQAAMMAQMQAQLAQQQLMMQAQQLQAGAPMTAAPAPTTM